MINWSGVTQTVFSQVDREYNHTLSPGVGPSCTRQWRHAPRSPGSLIGSVCPSSASVLSLLTSIPVTLFRVSTCWPRDHFASWGALDWEPGLSQGLTGQGYKSQLFASSRCKLLEREFTLQQLPCGIGLQPILCLRSRAVQPLTAVSVLLCPLPCQFFLASLPLKGSPASAPSSQGQLPGSLPSDARRRLGNE